jgi:hypothetical protein
MLTAIPPTRTKLFKAMTVYLSVYQEGNMTKRRTKGDGSVYQRKDGRFIGEYTNVLGKRRYFSGKKTEVLAKIKTKLNPERSSVAVREAPRGSREVLCNYSH